MRPSSLMLYGMVETFGKGAENEVRFPAASRMKPCQGRREGDDHFPTITPLSLMPVATVRVAPGPSNNSDIACRIANKKRA